MESSAKTMNVVISKRLRIIIDHYEKSIFSSSKFLCEICCLSRAGTVPRCRFIRSFVGVRKGTYFNMSPPVVAAERIAKTI